MKFKVEVTSTHVQLQDSGTDTWIVEHHDESEVETTASDSS